MSPFPLNTCTLLTVIGLQMSAKLDRLLPVSRVSGCLGRGASLEANQMLVWSPLLFFRHFTGRQKAVL